MAHEHLTPETLSGGATLKADRSAFLRKTYMHLFGAVLAFVGLEAWLFESGLALSIAAFMFKLPWLAILGAFIVASMVASHVAHRVRSRGAQYAALGGFVVAEALIFVPILFTAFSRSPEIVSSAASYTIIAFAGLTAVAIMSGRDFSFLRGLVMWGGIVAICTIVLGLIIGYQLGTWFSMAMIGLAGAAILYDTSRVLTDFPEDRYVAASLELFASVAMMFWYVLRLFMGRE